MHFRFKQSQPSWSFFDNYQELAKARINAPIHAACSFLKIIISSAAETEIDSAFNNAQEVTPIRYAFDFLGHPQPRTPMQVDDTTTVGFPNNTIKQTKTIGMRFYWLRDRESQDQFNIY